jgi:hypothetical protein
MGPIPSSHLDLTKLHAPSGIKTWADIATKLDAKQAALIKQFIAPPDIKKAGATQTTSTQAVAPFEVLLIHSADDIDNKDVEAIVRKMTGTTNSTLNITRLVDESTTQQGEISFCSPLSKAVDGIEIDALKQSLRLKRKYDAIVVAPHGLEDYNSLNAACVTFMIETVLGRINPDPNFQGPKGWLVLTRKSSSSSPIIGDDSFLLEVFNFKTHIETAGLRVKTTPHSTTWWNFVPINAPVNGMYDAAVVAKI